ncbi:MAG: hypothetical protein QW505_01250 [Thermoplasmata archaeon]
MILNEPTSVGIRVIDCENISITDNILSNHVICIELIASSDGATSGIAHGNIFEGMLTEILIVESDGVEVNWS